MYIFFQARERSYITGRKLKKVIFPTAPAENEVIPLYRCVHTILICLKREEIL